MSKLSEDIKTILFHTPQCLGTEIIEKTRTNTKSNQSMTFEFIETKPAFNNHQLKYLRQWAKWINSNTNKVKE